MCIAAAAIGATVLPGGDEDDGDADAAVEDVRGSCMWVPSKYCTEGPCDVEG